MADLNKITIAEVQKIKKVMQDAIAREVDSFEERTGILIAGIDLEMIPNEAGDGYVHVIDIDLFL